MIRISEFNLIRPARESDDHIGIGIKKSYKDKERAALLM